MQGDPSVYFDVDMTLVIHGLPDHTDALEFDYYGMKFKLVPHAEHIKRLKEHKTEGFKIVVWSAAGETWSREVVRVLQLEEFVDHCASKPNFFYDDLPTDEILHNHKRKFIPFNP